MAQLRRFAPIFPVSDVDASLGFYATLGFNTRAYEEGGYGFAERDRVELHLGVPPDGRIQPHSAYLFVKDADALAAEWRAAGIMVHGPEDTPWKQHEGVVIDPDGNTIRFGSPVR